MISLKSPHCPWSVEIDGADLVVRNIIATAFGGDYDSGDDGETESGLRTRGNMGLLGCALPIRSTEASTRLSPLAFKGPHIPWFTKVKVWLDVLGEDSALLLFNGVIDNGPNALKFPTHALDLTVAAAKHFAPQIPWVKIADTFEMDGLSYRILGAAKYALEGTAPSVPGSPTGSDGALPSKATEGAAS